TVLRPVLPARARASRRPGAAVVVLCPPASEGVARGPAGAVLPHGEGPVSAIRPPCPGGEGSEHAGAIRLAARAVSRRSDDPAGAGSVRCAGLLPGPAKAGKLERTVRRFVGPAVGNERAADGGAHSLRAGIGH